MTFKYRAIEFANEAKKNKEKLSNAQERVTEVDNASIKLMNFFAVFSLFALLMSTLFPVTHVMGSSMPLSEVTPDWLYALVTLALCSHLFGAAQVLSRGLMLVLLCAISFTLYEQVAGTLQTAQMFGSVRIDDGLTIALKVLGSGFYLFVISFVFVIFAALKPGYQANREFWNKIVQR